MCGIVAYCGPKRSSLSRDLVRCLEVLEYRGYDSAGVLTMTSSGLRVVKSVGAVEALAARLQSLTEVDAQVGMAHTRWATHGAVTEENAHPIVSPSGELALVLNGVVENDRALRWKIEAAGGQFATTSDAGTLLAAIEYHWLRAGRDLLVACEAALAEAEGRLAFCVAQRSRPDQLLAARRGSPLFIGRAGLAVWTASDPSAFPDSVLSVFELEDGATVSLNGGNISSDAESKLRKVSLVRPAEILSRGTASTFFEKEILEQPVTITRAVSAGLELGSLGLSRAETWTRVVFIGCGSAFYACLTGKLAFERWARIPYEVVLASEFLGSDAVVGQDTLLIAVSQSGETADTLAAAEWAVSQGVTLIAVTNTRSSALARMAQKIVELSVGVEVSVASTKAYTAMLVRLTLLAVELGVRRKTLSEADFRGIVAAAQNLSSSVKVALECGPLIRDAAQRWLANEAFMFTGRGFDVPSAFEGALKLRELSYRQAEGVAAGELKHGTIALINNGYPVVAISMDRRCRRKAAASVHEVQTRGADVLAIVGADDDEVSHLVKNTIVLPATDAVWSPILAAIPLQWLALHLSQGLGRNVDRPRNLAKSVTVV